MCNPLELLIEIAKEKTKLGKWDGQPLQLIKIGIKYEVIACKEEELPVEKLEGKGR